MFTIHTITWFYILVPPQINKNDIPGEGLTPKEVKIKVNSTLTLECEAEAIPTPALQWYKDGQVHVLPPVSVCTLWYSVILILNPVSLDSTLLLQILQADHHVSITANGRIVQIKHAQVSDTGRYTCIATNIAGEDEKDFDVNIQGELEWLMLMS